MAEYALNDNSVDIGRIQCTEKIISANCGVDIFQGVTHLRDK